MPRPVPPAVTTSQVTEPVSTMALIFAVSGLVSSRTLTPVASLNGVIHASRIAFWYAPPQLTKTMSSAAASPAERPPSANVDANAAASHFVPLIKSSSNCRVAASGAALRRGVRDPVIMRRDAA